MKYRFRKNSTKEDLHRDRNGQLADWVHALMQRL